jgi:hypothetical protein
MINILKVRQQSTLENQRYSKFTNENLLQINTLENQRYSKFTTNKYTRETAHFQNFH